MADEKKRNSLARLKRYRYHNYIPDPTAQKLWILWLQVSVLGSILLFAGLIPGAHFTVQALGLLLCTMQMAIFLPPELWAAIKYPPATLSWTVGQLSWFLRLVCGFWLPITAGYTASLWPLKWWRTVLYIVDTGPFTGLDFTVGMAVGIFVWFVLSAWLTAHFLARMEII